MSANTTRHETFASATELKVRDFHGKLHVEVWAGTGFEMHIVGPEDHVSKVDFVADGKRLVVTDSFSGDTNNSYSVVSRNSYIGSISVSGGDVTINGVRVGGTKPTDTVQATIKVPVGTPLNICGSATGETKIGDVLGNLEIDLSGTADVTCGKMLQAEIELTGCGDLEINEVSERLRVRMTGTSDVQVNGGRVKQLDVKSTGTGDFRFDGEAENADLKTSGTGDIRVKRVTNPPNKRVTGTGKIKTGT